MASHTAKSLFKQNIQSAEDLIQLFEGIKKLKTHLEISWLLRAAVVFAVAALDAYFHDKIKYRAGKYGLEEMPQALTEFQVKLCDLKLWEQSKRKGNVIRNWLTTHYSYRPLQRVEEINKALKFVGIEKLWETIELNSMKREQLLAELQRIIQRRNQIAHEGDRLAHRNSGKKLRDIDIDRVKELVSFIKDLVKRIEEKFPE